MDRQYVVDKSLKAKGMWGVFEEVVYDDGRKRREGEVGDPHLTKTRAEAEAIKLNGPT